MTIFDRLRNLKLSAGDFAIFGSGPLIVRGIIAASNDLDVLCRRQAWKTVQELGEPEYLSNYDVNIMTLCDGQLTFGEKWGIGSTSPQTSPSLSISPFSSSASPLLTAEESSGSARTSSVSRRPSYSSTERRTPEG